MRFPAVVIGPGTVEFVSSEDDLAQQIEAIDVKNNEYHAFDWGGHELSLIVDTVPHKIFWINLGRVEIVRLGKEITSKKDIIDRSATELIRFIEAASKQQYTAIDGDFPALIQKAYEVNCKSKRRMGETK